MPTLPTVVAMSSTSGETGPRPVCVPSECQQQPVSARIDRHAHRPADLRFRRLSLTANNARSSVRRPVTAEAAGSSPVGVAIHRRLPPGGSSAASSGRRAAGPCRTGPRERASPRSGRSRPGRSARRSTRPAGRCSGPAPTVRRAWSWPANATRPHRRWRRSRARRTSCRPRSSRRRGATPAARRPCRCRRRARTTRRRSPERLEVTAVPDPFDHVEHQRGGCHDRHRRTWSHGARQ